MNCKLVGNFVQHLEVLLSPGEDFYAEKGALIYYEDGIEFECLNRASGLKSFLKYKFAGESIFLIKYTNRSPSDKTLVVGTKYGLVPIKSNREFFVANGGYVASSAFPIISLNSSFKRGIGFMQKLQCKGTCFIDAKGSVKSLNLNPGEIITVDENHIIACIDISKPQFFKEKYSVKNVLGGEGVSLVELHGPGTVYIESAPAEYVYGNNSSSHRDNKFTLGCIGAILFCSILFGLIFLLN